jgi:hypothetical protein
MFGAYKVYFILGLCIAWSMGVWHVAARYENSSWQAEKVSLVQKELDTRNANHKLANDIGQKIDEKLSNITTTQTVINRKVEREIIEKPVYRDCVVPTTGVQLIEDAIRNKGQSPSK